jgi:preprotein translocase subunit SecA
MSILHWLGSLTDSNEKELKRLQPIVDKINALEPDFQALGDDGLREKTRQFKDRLHNGETLDDLLPEAYAAVREAAKRTIGQRHYDVQLMGGIVLHQGKVAEMKTGEGKTLVATLPLYLNALTGRGSHLVTVNDYLARRDAYWMAPIYDLLGLSVASIFPQQNPDEHLPALLYDPAYQSDGKRWPHYRPVSRREAYQADITYGTNNEFGFDYLRDNMVLDLSQCVQRELYYAIIDEVDNILIDEARTPLIISGAAEEATEKYHVFARAITQLREEEDYTIEEKTRTALLNENGIGKMERALRNEGVLKSPSLYDPSNYNLTQYLENALKAQVIFKRDRDYVVKDGQVIIVDEFTGRLMFGRRYSEGLHQAIEAKERVKIQRESVTLATITFQNYFRLYEKLAGMTGTAATEAEELHKIYKLEVVIIPTDKPMVREDFTDQIYKDEAAKFKAVAKEIEQLHNQGRPVLIGTVSIDKSERLSELLTKKGIPHQLLNAKNHVREADIIAEAGKTGAVTLSTNMAGRGVDILLGGRPPEHEDFSDGDREWEAKQKEWQAEHENVVRFGGLHVIGTERHESRRIDNQLRGRSGRQGDPGSTRFFVSLEDDIVRRFGGDRVKGFMEWAGMDENTPIEHSMVSKSIENAQVRVEGYHFDLRKHLVDYDDIVNRHREIIYSERKKVLSGADLKTNILTMVEEELRELVASHCGNDQIAPDFAALIEDLKKIFQLPPEMNEAKLSQMRPEQIEEYLIEYAGQLYEQREKEFGSEQMRLLERLIMLSTIDNLWKEHLTAMDNLRERAGLQSVRQIDPLVIYKKEGHALFESLLANIRYDLVHTIYRASITKRDDQAQKKAQKKMVPAGKKVGRNDPCPCGSGKKYKHCCGR